MARRADVLDVRRGVSLAAPFRLSLHCIISLRDGDPSLPRRVFWFVVVDAFVTIAFFKGRVVSPTPTPLSFGRAGPTTFMAGQWVYSMPNPEGEAKVLVRLVFFPDRKRS